MVGAWQEGAHGAAVRAFAEVHLAREVAIADPNLKIFVGLLCSLTLMWTGLFGKALALVEAMRRIAAAPGITTMSSTFASSRWAASVLAFASTSSLAR